jgi:hypothetical protein
VKLLAYHKGIRCIFQESAKNRQLYCRSLRYAHRIMLKKPDWRDEDSGDQEEFSTWLLEHYLKKCFFDISSIGEEEIPLED